MNPQPAKRPRKSTRAALLESALQALRVYDFHSRCPCKTCVVLAKARELGLLEAKT